MGGVDHSIDDGLVLFVIGVSGEISYNGHRLDEFVSQKTSAYISQYDLHIPEMTVRETIDFSARCQGVGSRAGMNTRAYRVFPLETILRIKCIENNKRQLLRNIEGNNIFRFSQQSAHL
ncbi:pleiotropic drug resistance [Trifolium repens]|nr:pleiotropic drug resistance [Trifolium repens]